MSKSPISFAVLCWAVFGLAAAVSAASEPAGPIVFQDTFETLVTGNGAQRTRPAVFGGVGQPGGVVHGTAKLVDGKEGRALQLSGDTMVVYPPVESLNLLGGELSFWVKLNFNPTEKRDEKTAWSLRNQMFLSFTAPDGSLIAIYTCLADVRVMVRNSQSNIVQLKDTQLAWEKGAWHQLKLQWGNQLALSVDGELRFSVPWDGLFGPLPVRKEKLAMVLGNQPGSSVISEFTVDELVFRAPVEGALGCRPLMALPLLENAPALDGNLDKEFWKNACEVTGFVGFSEREVTHYQPCIYGAYTTAGLFFGLRARLPDGARPQAMLTGRDAKVYGEDALEIYLQPPKTAARFYQFLTSAIGTQMDVIWTPNGGADLTYNPEWEVKTQSRPGEWTAEIFIPFKALNLPGMPAAGEVWRGNFILDSATGFSNAATWAFTGGAFTDPINLGDLLFTGKARTLREESFAGFREGNPEASFRVVGELPPVITLRAEIFDSNGSAVFDHSVKMHDAPSAVVGTKFLQAGIYTARLTAVDEAGTTFFRQNVLFRPQQAFALSVENFAYAGMAEATARAKTLAGKVKNISFRVLSVVNQPVATVAAMPLDKDGNAVAQVPTEKLQPGDYTVEALALNEKGETVDSAKQLLRIFPKPAWWKNDLGLDHSVPPPWEPVKATEKGFAVWGRDYQFGDAFFPRQIVNQGVALFQSSPRLILRANKGETDLVSLRRDAKVTSFPDEVELLSTAEADGVSVRCKGTLEFDGFSRYDVELKPNGAKTVDGLVLEVPLIAPLARFLVASNGSSASVSELKMPYASPFVAHLWVGNDDMGLVFFAESQQYWTPQDGRMIEIVPDGAGALLRVNFIRQSRQLNGPITFSFGLMASPVRPLPDLNDPFVHLMGEWVLPGPDAIKWPDDLTYPAAGRIFPQEGTLEFWVRPTEAAAGRRLELFNLLSKKGSNSIQANFSDGKIAMTVGGTALMSGAGTLKPNEFSNLAFVWDAQDVSLYLDGRQIATVKASSEFRSALQAVSEPGGVVRLGCALTNGADDTAIVVDDLRLSRTARYHGSEFPVPTAPLAKDETATLLDPLDEDFVPDGQDAFTTAGGLPTVGCRFVAGKWGKGLEIEVAPPRPATEVAKDLGADFGMCGNWNYGTTSAAPLNWPPVMFAPVAAHSFEEATQATHRHGLKMLTYTCYPALGIPTPLAEQFAPEWELQPISILPFPPPEGHCMLNCSLSSKGFADYYAAGTAWLMDTFGVDGIYTDGLASVDASANIHGRAGYRDEEGNVHPTVPIFGVREGIKRLYRIAKARKPDGIVINHLSFNMILPTMSFSDIGYTGEQEDYENLLNARIRFSSKPWGIPLSLLGTNGCYSSLDEMICLLHATPNMGYGPQGPDDMGRKLINIHRAYLRAGTLTAQWIPYFKNNGIWYATDDSKVKVSLYYHPGKDALLIVGNLEGKDKRAMLRLKLSAFGLEPATLRARNALTEQPLALAADGALAVPVRAKSFTLVSLKVPSASGPSPR